MSEGLEAVVSSLRAQTTMMIDILKDIQSDMKGMQQDIKSNYMPSNQVEERFKAQGERISSGEKSHVVDIMRIEDGMKVMSQDIKDKFKAWSLDVDERFKALALAAKEENNRKRDTPFKTISAILGLLSIAGFLASALIYFIKSLS